MQRSSIPIPFFDTKTDDEPYLQNSEALEVLQDEINNILSLYASVAASGILGCFFPAITIPCLTALTGVLVSKEYALRVTNLFEVVKLLLDAYQDEGIVVTPRVKTNSATIDLFVRMPDKRAFALMIRGGTRAQSITWREDLQQFRANRKGGGVDKCGHLDNAVRELGTIVDWKSNNHPILGTSSRERKVQVIKTIVLPKNSRISDSNPTDAIVSFGKAKRILKICAPTTTYVVEFDQLTNFVAKP